jgi:predicted alpha/beta-hydrolase family hydrolase
MLSLMKELMIPVLGNLVSASLHGEAGTLLALGHGAGGNRKALFLVTLAEALASSGRRVVLFNFPYSERRSRIPDPAETLEATITEVARYAREELGATQLVLGGKSMGGRIASQAVAKGLAADALVFLGYPLHPPGRPERLRDVHLKSVGIPMLFVQGTRDTFARWDLLSALLDRLGERATLLAVEGGDHSFRVPRKLAPDPAAAEAAIRETLLSWLVARGL